jgi:phosphodiesterase/alkaline phosphatase D-like protein
MISRRRALVGGAAAAALIGCEPKVGPPGDTGEPTPVRAPEPAPYDAPGAEDLTTFPYGIQTGDATDASVIVSVRTTAGFELVLLEGGDGWTEVQRQTLTPTDGVAQVTLTGLSPDTVYTLVAYADADRRSLAARFRTALGSSQRIVVFGATSCLRENHPWPSLSFAAAEHLDFFCLLGDTIYVDYSPDAWDYETKWNTALSTAGLKDLTGSTSVIATWDDHEVANNYSFDEEGIEEKFAAGLAAFRRGLPLGHGPDGASIWRTLSWGGVLDVFVLDCRGERRDGRYISVEQMDWLKAGLLSSTARFKIILNSVPITDLSAIFGPAELDDRWDGYPEQRTEILTWIRDNHIAALWITGDVHYAQVGHVDPAGGPGADQWEVLAGPGGSTPNYIVEAFVGNEQYAFLFAEWNWVRFTCDPQLGTILVAYVGDDGAELASMELTV